MPRYRAFITVLVILSSLGVICIVGALAPPVRDFIGLSRENLLSMGLSMIVSGVTVFVVEMVAQGPAEQAVQNILNRYINHTSVLTGSALRNGVVEVWENLNDTIIKEKISSARTTIRVLQTWIDSTRPHNMHGIEQKRLAVTQNLTSTILRTMSDD